MPAKSGPAVAVRHSVGALMRRSLSLARATAPPAEAIILVALAFGVNHLLYVIETTYINMGLPCAVSHGCYHILWYRH
jgi:hypothetical protein